MHSNRFAPQGRHWAVFVRLIVVVVATLAVLALPLLAGCDDGPIAVNKRFAESVQVYFDEAHIILDDFMAGDEVMLGLADKVQAGETITEADEQAGKDALAAMDDAHQAWLVLEAPDPDVHAAQLKIEEAMRNVRAADKNLLLGVSTGDMATISDANAERAAGMELYTEAVADLEAWYDDNRHRIAPYVEE